MSETSTIDLSPFCDGYYPKPWKKDGVIYATDSRVAVRMVSNILCDEWTPPGGSRRKPPDIDKIMQEISLVEKWYALPEIPPCDECKNKYEITESCDSCGGTGMCTCRCEDEHHCGYCDGTGEQTDYCDCKTGFAQSNRTANSRIVAKVATLPNVKWGVADDVARNPIFFLFDGGDGVFMPLDPKRRTDT